jgi:hypothetical protein
MKIYVASSWRNWTQPAVVAALREAGHEVYDFRNPAPGDNGFGWRQLGLGDAKEWTPEIFREALRHPVARRGFDLDMNALRACDACVLVLPCGRSAHLELGWATGAGKRTLVLTAETLDEPELMYLMHDGICLSIDEVIAELEAAHA